MNEKTGLVCPTRDSPRNRWRKRYEIFVREAEWALPELRKDFSQEQYESIVIGTSVALAKENSTDFVDMMNSASEQKPNEKAANSDGKPSRRQKMIFDMFNPAGFLTGSAEITELVDPVGGRMTMYIPEFAWHICGAQSQLPNPKKLPEEGCLLICKGAFEELFGGDCAAMSITSLRTGSCPCSRSSTSPRTSGSHRTACIAAAPASHRST